MEWLDTQMKKYNLMNRLLFVQNKINPLLWLYLIRDSSDKADNDARSTNNFVLVCASPSQSDIFGEYFVVVLSIFKLCEFVIHMGPEGLSNRKRIPIIFLNAKLSGIAKHLQKCKS